MAAKHNNFYTDLDELPIYNFYKCIAGSMHFMYIDKKGEDNKLVRSEWNKLYNKYCELTFNNSTLKYYRLVGEIEFLKNRKIFAPVLLGLLLKTPKNELKPIITELKKWKINLSANKDLDKEIEKGLKILSNSENSINRKTNELQDIKDKPTKSISLQTQKAKLHKILGLDINLHTTSVTEWLAYWDEVKNVKNEQ